MEMNDYRMLFVVWGLRHFDIGLILPRIRENTEEHPMIGRKEITYRLQESAEFCSLLAILRGCTMSNVVKA